MQPLLFEYRCYLILHRFGAAATLNTQVQTFWCSTCKPSLHSNTKLKRFRVAT